MRTLSKTGRLLLLLAGGSISAFTVTAACAGPVTDPFTGLSVVSDQSLSALHGRDGNVSYAIKGQNNLNASITGSSVSAGGNITNGDVSFSGNAMQNLQGLSNFIANTGYNNNLQAAMVVNVTLQ